MEGLCMNATDVTTERRQAFRRMHRGRRQTEIDQFLYEIAAARTTRKKTTPKYWQLMVCSFITGAMVFGLKPRKKIVEKNPWEQVSSAPVYQATYVWSGFHRVQP